jgi:nitroreductase
MNKNTQALDEIINRRRSVRHYDPNVPFESEAVIRSIERAVLAPTSSNMQLWEFHHIKNPEYLKKMAKYCMGQNAAKTCNEMVVIVARKDLWKNRAKANLLNALPDLATKDKSSLTKREKRQKRYYQTLMPVIYTDFLGVLGWIKFFFVSLRGILKVTFRQVKLSDGKAIVHKSAALAAQNFMLSMTAEGYDTCPMEGSDTVRIKRLLGLPGRAKINMVIACGTRKEEGVYGERFRVPLEEVYKVH